MKKLLIVEDEKALRDAYTYLCKTQKAYQVLAAANGHEALPIIKSEKPDIIILDILMPVMNGIELLEAIKLKKNYPDTKVLVLSNLSDQKTIQQVKKLGATDYLLKASASPRELLTAIKSL